MAYPAPHASGSGNNWDVIVVGAGIAGVSAANRLHAKGYKVLVLEARERVGGRIWSRPVKGGAAMVDFGASWIHGVHGNPIAKVAREHGIVTTATDDDSATAYYKGRKLTDAKGEQFEELYDQWEEFQEQMGNRSKKDRPLSAAVKAFVLEEELEGEQLDGLLYEVHSTVELDYAAPADQMSIWNWAEDSELGGGDAVFPGGYSQVVEAVAAGLYIQTQMPVASVTYGSTGVTITTQAGPTFTAKAAVIAVPLGVLKAGTISFQPPLPSHKQASITKMGVGLLQKTVMVFPHKFWDSSFWLSRIPEAHDRDRWAEFVNQEGISKEPILIGLNTGPYAVQNEGRSDNEVVEDAMVALRQMYGPNIPYPIEAYVSRWGSDPYSRGAYSFPAIGCTLKDNRNLGQTVQGVLFFAGEATNDKFPATVHGAYISGLDAAKAVEREVAL